MELLTTILTVIWAALNSPAGIAAVAGLVLWAINKLYAARPAWQQYEGAIITGIKLAEKQIPDDTPNKSLAKADAALRYVLKVYAEANKGRQPNANALASIKDGIAVVHAELESAGGLPNPGGDVITAKNAGKVRVGILACIAGLISLIGCTTVVVTPKAGPVTIGTTTSMVSTDSQETDVHQVPTEEAPEDGNAD
jgi:hypothetical protein